MQETLKKLCNTQEGPYPLSCFLSESKSNPINIQALESESIKKTGIGINLFIWLESNYSLELKWISFFALESESNYRWGESVSGPVFPFPHKAKVELAK